MIKSIMGLDLSITSTGVCLLPSDITFSISTNNKLPLEERIAKIVSGIRDAPHKYDFVFIEGYAFGARSSSITPLAELTGVVKNMLYRMETHFVSVPPTVIKKYLTGSGVANKDQMRLNIYKKFGKEFKTTDECDAYALCDFGYHILNEPRRKLTEEEKSVIHRFKVEHELLNA